MQELVREEIRRRIGLANSIDGIIATYFMQAPAKRLKRGAVQEFILAALDMSRTALLCNLINDRMAAAGYRPSILKGNQYYSNVSLLPT